LWARVKRELEAFLTGLFEAGALRGGSPEEAFVVRCDADTNPPSSRQTAGVSAEVALAAAGVHELVVVRIVVDASGVAITESSRP
jgi:phage tail sheath protein FI